MPDPWEEAAKQFKGGAPAPEAATQGTPAPNDDWKVWNASSQSAQPAPDNTAMASIKNVGSHLKNMVMGPIHAFGDAPADAAEAGIAAGSAGTPLGSVGSHIALGLNRMFIKPTTQGVQTAVEQAKRGNYGLKNNPEYDEHGNYTPTMMSGIADAIPLAGPWARNVETEANQKGVVPALAGLATDALAPIGAGRVMKAAAPAMQSGGVGIINRTVGATERNFMRGKNPGQAYFDEGMGPSISMGSIARKASTAKGNVGAQIGTAVDDATAAGTQIPNAEFAPRILDPINKHRNVLQGPGGGSTAGIDALEDTFTPTLAKPHATPRELMDIKKNVSENTAWNPATELGLKQTRQRIAGGLSEPLEAHVPELEHLNPRYANASELSKLAQKRSSSGVPVLSQIARKGGEAALGGAIGYATHNPLLGLAPLALDTVPARTAIASGLYYGGNILPSISKAAPLVGPIANLGRVKKEKPREEANEK